MPLLALIIEAVKGAFVKSTNEPDTNNDPVISADPENGNPSPSPLLYEPVLYNPPPAGSYTTTFKSPVSVSSSLPNICPLALMLPFVAILPVVIADPVTIKVESKSLKLVPKVSVLVIKVSPVTCSWSVIFPLPPKCKLELI